jgi:hypothetical protein
MADCVENNKKTQPLQNTQQTLSKPVLPLTVPSVLPGASSAVSPNISVPLVTSNTMSVQNSNINAQLLNSQKSVSLPDLPKLPILLPSSTSVAGSASSVPVLSQKIQLIKSLLGTVIEIGSKKGDILWLDVKNEFSGEIVRINVDSKKTRVIKKDILQAALKDIKVGDMVKVIFNQTGKKVPVNVISIITKEDLKTSASPE